MKVLAWMRSNRWSFSAIGVLVLWVVLSVLTSHFNLNSLSGVATSASFLVIVAIGQMFVDGVGHGGVRKKHSRARATYQSANHLPARQPETHC